MKLRSPKRIPFIEQMEQSECGVCCLAMLLGYYGCHVPLHELRERGGAGRDGTSLLLLRDMARGYAMEAAGRRVGIDGISKTDVPCILHWEHNHFVVLERIGKRRATIVDPGVGRMNIPIGQFAERYSGVLMTMKPTAGFVPRKRQPIWTSYFKLLRRHSGLVSQVVVMSLWIQMLALAAPISIRVLIDEVILPKETGFLHAIGIGFAALAFVQTLFLLLRSRTLVLLQNRLDWSLMSAFLGRLLRLPYSFFLLRSNGDLIVRANSNLMIRDILSNRTVTALLDGGMVVFFLLFMLERSPALTGWVVAAGALQAGISLLARVPIRQLSQEQILKQTAATNSFVETLRGITDVKAGGMETLAYERWERLYKGQLDTQRRRGVLEAGVDSVVGGLKFAAPLLLLWLGTNEVLNYRMTLGELFAFYTLAAAFLTPLSTFVTTLNHMIMLGVYLNRVLDIHRSREEQEDGTAAVPPHLTGKVELRGVSFRYYPGGPEVIRDVSVTIEPGRKVAIVGASGSGKSTLAGLLLGLYAPASGEVRFDGIDLERLDKRALRSRLGVVTQSSFIFNRTIAENIAIHDPGMPMEPIVQAAVMAGIHEDIMKMPQQYRTLVSEGGTNLSGGQRQRIALARALVRNPAIVLLDEATSALDMRTEAAVERNLSRLSCTRIVIAHRHSTVADADLILVLQGGMVAEAGKHDELLAAEGLYAALYRQLQPC
ncbi:peptidase domain-containing ABC transporter [Paenibacillus sp. GYB004]|uniref:peptidase domain-containing ABC transporter n=1 Tax=Paenibacillus sp. GYB004 TaxID=2994393 RepID=UPI002F9686A0